MVLEKHILYFLSYYKNLNYNLFMTSGNKIYQVALEFKEFDNDGKDMEKYSHFRNEMGANFPVLIISSRRIGKYE